MRITIMFTMLFPSSSLTGQTRFDKYLTNQAKSAQEEDHCRVIGILSLRIPEIELFYSAISDFCSSEAL